MTATPALERRRGLTYYVPIPAIVLLTLAVLWVVVVQLAISATTRYDGVVTGLNGGHCVVQWTSAAGTSHTSDVACLGRGVGAVAPLLASDPEGATVTDYRSILILEWVVLVCTGLPGLIGVAARLMGIHRARRLEDPAADLPV